MTRPVRGKNVTAEGEGGRWGEGKGSKFSKGQRATGEERGAPPTNRAQRDRWQCFGLCHYVIGLVFLRDPETLFLLSMNKPPDTVFIEDQV